METFEGRAACGWDEFRRRPRVFNIGLNKTGTTSFAEAMRILGLRTLHWGGPAVERAVRAAFEAEQPLLINLDPRYDAFSDIGDLSRRFRRLDRQYPGSRFVMTVRPLDEWVASRRKHVERNARRQAKGKYLGSFVALDEERWRAQWNTHTTAAREYFAGRHEFLEVDITTDPRWQPLCSFLDLPEPTVSFPCINGADLSLLAMGKNLARRVLTHRDPFESAVVPTTR